MPVTPASCSWKRWCPESRPGAHASSHGALHANQVGDLHQQLLRHHRWIPCIRCRSRLPAPLQLDFELGRCSCQASVRGRCPHDSQIVRHLPLVHEVEARLVAEHSRHVALPRRRNDVFCAQAQPQRLPAADVEVLLAQNGFGETPWGLQRATCAAHEGESMQAETGAADPGTAREATDHTHLPIFKSLPNAFGKEYVKSDLSSRCAPSRWRSTQGRQHLLKFNESYGPKARLDFKSWVSTMMCKPLC